MNGFMALPHRPGKGEIVLVEAYKGEPLVSV